MTIAQVATQTGLTADTLRYYERIGLIPRVARANGIRNYTDRDLRWVEFIQCMRGAGVSIETLVEYVALFPKGTETRPARKALLTEQRGRIAQRIAELQTALARLDRKLDGYEERMSKVEDNLRHFPD